jgi:hypothetical protein
MGSLRINRGKRAVRLNIFSKGPFSLHAFVLGFTNELSNDNQTGCSAMPARRQRGL